MIITTRGLKTALVLGLAVTALGAGASAAGASPKPVPHAGLSKVGSYTQVVTAPVTVQPGASQFADALCPSGTKVFSGGLLVNGSDINENTDSSTPLLDGSGWTSYLVNNASAADTFQTYAVCGRQPAKYAVLSGSPVLNPAGEQTGAYLACSKGTVALGGGSTNGSDGVLSDIAINSSYPALKGWHVDVNNANPTTDNHIYVQMVCAKKPSGYTVQTGPGSTYGPSTQGNDDATCPTGTKVLGGGNYSSSTSVSVDLNSTFPLGSTGWRAFIDNTGSVSSTVKAYAICAN